MNDIAESFDPLAAICRIMMLSPSHRQFRIADLEWLILPPLRLGQLQLFRVDGLIVGYASWAYLSDDVVRDFTSKGSLQLGIEDWKSGDNLWLIDLLGPPDRIDEFKTRLKQTVFEDRSVSTLMPEIADGKVIGFRQVLL